MATTRCIHTYLLFLLIVVDFIHLIRGDSNEEVEVILHHVERRQACPDSTMCRSKWGYCGTGPDYCGDGCTAGPCFGSGGGNTGDGSIITEQNFACAFNTIDAGTRFNRFTGLKNSGWKPTNRDEAAVFLAHVFHETDGLKVIREYCAPGLYDINTFCRSIENYSIFKESQFFMNQNILIQD